MNVHYTLQPAGAAITPWPGGYFASYWTTSCCPDVRTYDDFSPSQTTTLRGISWQGMYCRINSTTVPVPNVIRFKVTFGANLSLPQPPNSPWGQEMSILRTAANERFERSEAISCNDQRGVGVLGLYTYSATLPTSVTVQSGQTYSVNIVAEQPSGSDVHWMWRYGTPDNNRVTFSDAGRIQIYDAAWAVY